MQAFELSCAQILSWKLLRVSKSSLRMRVRRPEVALIEKKPSPLMVLSRRYDHTGVYPAMGLIAGAAVTTVAVLVLSGTETSMM